jgi:cell division protein FtsL
MSGKGPTVRAVLVYLLPVLLAGALFAAVGIVHVSARVLVVRTGYQLSELEADNRALTRENDRLKLELATLKNPARLERIAREELGMIPASPGDVTTLVPSPRLGRTPVRDLRPEVAANVRAEGLR